MGRGRKKEKAFVAERVRAVNFLDPEAAIRAKISTRRSMAIDGKEIVAPRDLNEGQLDDKFRDREGNPRELEF